MIGCAKLPPPAEMEAEVSSYHLPKLPEDGKALVYIVRPSPVGGFVRFNVFVDSKAPESEIGYTRAVQYIYSNLMSGDHQMIITRRKFSHNKCFS